MRSIFHALDAHWTRNEAQAEQAVNEPVLVELGWHGLTSRQFNMSVEGREDVPDFLLYADAAEAPPLALSTKGTAAIATALPFSKRSAGCATPPWRCRRAH